MDDDQRVRVSRRLVPSYDVDYPEQGQALVDAELMARGQPIVLECQVHEPPGSAVVVSFRFRGVTATLLLEVVNRGEAGGGCMLRWVSRRRTDGDVLALWLRTLRGLRQDAISPGEQFRMLEVCRRLCSPNPLLALGVQYSCTGREAQQASSALGEILSHFEARAATEPRVVAWVVQARVALADHALQLASVSGRRLARDRWGDPEGQTVSGRSGTRWTPQE